MSTTQERIEGHYEVRQGPYGKVYGWESGYALVEGDRGRATMHQEIKVASPWYGAEHTSVRMARSEYHGGLFSGLKGQDEINRLLEDIYG